jgi:hypothetical protein
MFTDKQLADFRAYRIVQLGGRWNMFDPRAMKATRLSSEEYSFVMKNYVALKVAADKAASFFDN